MRLILLFLVSIITINGRSQSSTNWETRLYGYEYNSPKEVLLLDNEQSIVVLGKHFSKKREGTYGLLKMDIYGNILKEHHAGSKYKTITSMEVFRDRLLLIGHNGSNSWDKKLWIQITDLNFNPIKDMVFDSIKVTDFPSPKIKVDSQGNYIVMLNGDSNLIKFDKDFKVVWEKKFENEFCTSNSSSCIRLEDFIFDEAGNIIITGNGQPFYDTNAKYLYDLFVIKTDPNGNQFWRKTISSPNLKYYGHSITSYHGEYYIAGRQIANNTNFPNKEIDITFAKFSNNGELLFNKPIGGSEAEICSKILSNQDGTFYIIGRTQSNDKEYSKNNGKSDNLILKVDFKGDILETLIFGTTENDNLYDIVKTKGNTHVIIGDSNFGLDRLIYKEWKIYSKKLK